MNQRYTPEERARVRAEALKMLEEDDRRSRRPEGGRPPSGTTAQTRVRMQMRKRELPARAPVARECS